MHASILVVDDTPANLRLLCSMLFQKNGYEIRPVTDGATALSAAKMSPPDLILLDINMPQMNGYEVCEALKADDRLVDIPVIFISALNETVDKVRAFETGGVDYISKPFHIDEVTARIETQLRLRRLQQQIERRNQELERVNHFFDSTLEYMAYIITRGTWSDELLNYIEQVRREFDQVTEMHAAPMKDG
jgi:PleD family two-component response regulator